MKEEYIFVLDPGKIKENDNDIFQGHIDAKKN